ncbi:ketopantoate reductase family protein [Paraburkholderia sp. BR10923]|uniref:ketopantoate reductase family protein n=1 Tax=Paraburkholderia sp. BR10923 TaxID=3236992 RepID=UPI0034CE9DF9
MLRVCIFGGGAIGGYLAAHLTRAGRCEVSVVARGRTLDAIRSHGLRVRTASEAFTVPVRATSDTRELGVQDYVFITLKAHQVEGALEQIAPLIGPDTAVLPPTTGIPYYFFHAFPGPFDGRQLPALDREGRQWRVIPPTQVLGCVYWIGAHASAPGVIVQDGAKAGCPIGELDGSDSPRVRALSELLCASGIDSKVNKDIRSAIWMKFVNSLAFNPVALLTQGTLGEMAEASGVLNIVRTMMTEADAMAVQLGLAIGPAPDRRIALTVSASNHKMSMLQDLEAGRPLELEPLSRSIRALRDLKDVATPVLDAVLAMAQLRSVTAAHAINTQEQHA